MVYKVNGYKLRKQDLITTTTPIQYKNELIKMCAVIHYINNCKFWHSRRSIYFHYSCLWSNIETSFCQILKFIIGILTTIITYIFLILTLLWCKGESYIQESKFIITYQHTLNLSRKIPNNLNLTLLLPTDAHYVKKHRVIKTF